MPQMPGLPRIPKMVAPASLAPADILKTMGVNDEEAISALIQEPLARAGINIPKFTSPASIMSKTVAGMQLPVLPASLPPLPKLPGMGGSTGGGNSGAGVSATRNIGIKTSPNAAGGVRKIGI